MKTLKQTLAVQIAMLLLAMLVLGTAAVWGPTAVKQNFDVALSGHDALRVLYESGARFEAAKRLDDEDASRAESRRAALALKTFLDHGNLPATDRITIQPFQDLLALARQAGASHTGWERDAILDDALGKVAALSSLIRASILREQQSGERTRRWVLLAGVALCAIALIGSIVVTRFLYRAVTRPLGEISRAAHLLSSGNLQARAQIPRPQEFADLAGDFNRMAGQLQANYADLEERVAVKSRELVRSERLAGVGYLAAGVAHEISNPLGIMSGHAELSLRAVEQGNVDPIELAKSLKIVINESFRCKGIIQQLLSLSRAQATRERVNLADIADEVVDMVSGLSKFERIRLAREGTAGDDLEIFANAGEMKQVILNLVINAMEAVAPADGWVTVNVATERDTVVLTVSDSGRGLSASALSHLFEPFMQADASDGRRGVGLGLSITHSIVLDHGGSIDATSPGLRQGSTFQVGLPRFQEQR